jgi:hypothetical protein
MNMTTVAKKFVTAAVAALSIGATVALSASPAEAKFGRKGAFFGGVAAALVGSAIIASHAHAHRGYGYGYSCWREKRPVFNRWGDFRGYRYIRVCN